MSCYRSVLEVLKFLCPEDTLHNTSFVTRTWTRASESPELWYLYNEDLGCPVQSRPPKEAYRLKLCAQISLALIEPESMERFNCRKLVWGPKVRLTSPVQVYYNSAIAMLADGSVLVCGGGVRIDESPFRERPLNSAYRIVSDGTVYPLSPLLHARMLHGIIEARNTVYTFGGRSIKDVLLSCEKLEIDYRNPVSVNEWSPLPDMLVTIWGFNPCLLNTRIFIGGRGDTSLVVLQFDILTNSFEYTIMKMIGYSLQGSAFLHSGDLVILQPDHLTRFSVSDGNVKEEQPCGRVFSYGVMNPVVEGNRLYHLDQVSRFIYCFDISSGKSVPIPANRLR